MKTPLGDVHDSWQGILGHTSNLLMLEVIKSVCNLSVDTNILKGFSMDVSELKAMIIVDTKWGHGYTPLEYDTEHPPRVAENVRTLLGKYPDTGTWASKGVLCLAYPMYVPRDMSVERFTPVWHGWITGILKGISGLPHKKSINVLLMGRNSHNLTRHISVSIRVVKSADPTTNGYIKLAKCPFKELSGEIDW